MVDAVSRGVPRVHLTTPVLGPSEAFRACLGLGMALEWLRMASKVLGRGLGYFSKKVPHKRCSLGTSGSRVAWGTKAAAPKGTASGNWCYLQENLARGITTACSTRAILKAVDPAGPTPPPSPIPPFPVPPPCSPDPPRTWPLGYVRCVCAQHPPAT